MSSQKDAGCRSAFTLIETLVVIAIVAILLALIVPALAQVRREGKKTVCLANGRQVYSVLATYTQDSRSYFPSFVSDRNPPPDQNNSWYGLQSYRLLSSDAWVRYSGLDRRSRFAQCPSKPWEAIVIDDKWFLTSFVLSATTLISPAYLSPTLTPSEWRATAGARVQRIDAVTFPSDKVWTYELSVWHGWTGAPPPGRDWSARQYTGSLAPGTVAFMDGHVVQRFPAGSQYVDRYPVWHSLPYSTTVHGIFGRD